MSSSTLPVVIVGAGPVGLAAAPTFLMLTGYEQARSVVAAIAGDWEAARRVELLLPQTGVCTGLPASLSGISPAAQTSVSSALSPEPYPFAGATKVRNARRAGQTLESPTRAGDDRTPWNRGSGTPSE